MIDVSTHARERMRRCWTVTSVILLGALSVGTVAAEGGVRRPAAEISMTAYFNTLREQHPILDLIKQTALKIVIPEEYRRIRPGSRM